MNHSIIFVRLVLMIFPVDWFFNLEAQLFSKFSYPFHRWSHGSPPQQGKMLVQKHNLHHNQEKLWWTWCTSWWTWEGMSKSYSALSKRLFSNKLWSRGIWRKKHQVWELKAVLNNILRPHQQFFNEWISCRLLGWLAVSFATCPRRQWSLKLYGIVGWPFLQVKLGMRGEHLSTFSTGQI